MGDDSTFTFHPEWWNDEEKLRAAYKRFRTGYNLIEAAKQAGHGCSPTTLARRCRQFGIKLKAAPGGGYVDEIPVGPTDVSIPVSEETFLDGEIHQLLTKPKFKNNTVSVIHLADHFDVSPKTIRAALDRLRRGGYRIPEEDDNSGIQLQTIPPTKAKTFKSPFSGQFVRFGVVSDTHLSSNEQALEELHHAYDVFEQEGITQVYHPGDFTTGVGIYRTQATEIFNHTFKTQVDYMVENYPKRKGITTSGITGNHDIEGDFGKIGANPVVALAHEREDIEFLGDFKAWINIHTEENPCWLYLLHPKGGMSYAYSYKAQKLVDGFPEERRPDILIAGHWHVQGNFAPRGVQVMFPGCFEWKSTMMERLGLQPAVGYHIVECNIAENGQIARWKPEWFPLRERPTTGIRIPDRAPQERA